MYTMPEGREKSNFWPQNCPGCHTGSKGNVMCDESSKLNSSSATVTRD
jgi:hypothetical protein